VQTDFLSINIDSQHDRKKFYFEITGHADGKRDGSYSRSGGITLNARPSSNLVLSVAPYLTRAHDHTQYVRAEADPTATGTFGNALRLRRSGAALPATLHRRQRLIRLPLAGARADGRLHPIHQSRL
jgi:hypothetical protein